MAGRLPALHRNLLLGAAALALAACSGGPSDWDLRGQVGNGGAFSTAPAAEQATLARPRPDSRGVISYPGYQVVVAQRGDTVTSIASRLGIAPGELARTNALDPNATLNEGAVLALPGRLPDAAAPAVAGSGGVPAAGGGDTTAPPPAAGQIDITSLASGAIARAQSSDAGVTSAPAPAAPKPAPTVQQPAAAQPIKHKVARGETAYTIARLYNVPVRSLADWNGLGSSLSVHEGQVLLIPPVDPSKPAPAPTPAAVSPPGGQSNPPEPPSASKPLPSTTPPAASASTALPASPNMAKGRTAASAAQLAMPVEGAITRDFNPVKGRGIEIAAKPGAPIYAATDGTVLKVLTDAKGVTGLLIKHDDTMYLAYANVANVSVKEGTKVKRGQQIAVLASGGPNSLHFEVLGGHLEQVDPTPLLK